MIKTKKNKKILSKKGITPLMITLLLVSFAVAVGVMVMNFGRAQVEDAAECAIDIGLKFSNVAGKDQICYDQSTSKVSFTLENGVNIKVEGLIINSIGVDNADSSELNDAKIGKAGVYKNKVSYNSVANGELQQIKIVPKVVLYEEEIVCSEQALVAEDIKNC